MTKISPNDECRNAGTGSRVNSWGSTSFGLRISTFIRHWLFGYLVIFSHRAFLPILVVLAPIGSVWAQEGVDKPVFEKDVVPILKSYCWSCHGVGGRSAELDLRTLPLLLRRGKHGPAIVRGSAEQSLLYQKLIEREMPPDEPVEENVVYSPVKPTDAQIETIRRWIDTAGALLWLTNRRDIMGEQRNGWVMNLAATLGFLLLLAMAWYTAAFKVWPYVRDAL